MFLLLVYFFIALFFSFLCSVLEAVLLSITPSFIGAKQREKKAYAHELGKLKEDVDRPLAAILTLNTFAHTIGAAGVGAQAQKLWGEEYLSVTSAVLTLAILIFSEIIPKTLGATYWRHLARSSTYLLKVLMVILYPFVAISQLITRMIKGHEYKVKVTRADFSAMAEISSQEGALHEREFKTIQNILRFSQVKVKDIMTPRNVIFAIQEDTLLKELDHQSIAEDFSRIPVYRENVDQITGFVLKNELLMHLAEDQHQLPLKDIRRDVLFVEEEMLISKLFRQLIDRREHIAIALEEYGGTAGIVTMEDIIETMLGLEIMDEQDHVEDMQKYAREKSKQAAESDRQAKNR
jgi:CBS domain containing-hemolysin-like protein